MSPPRRRGLADVLAVTDRPGSQGPKLVTSDAHAGLVAAIGATLPGAAWQRCRTHYTTNLMAITPKASWPWVRTLLHSVFDQPDAESVDAQYDQVIEALATSSRKWPTTWRRPARTCWRSPPSPRIWRQIWSNNPCRSGSTKRSAAAPTLSASSPTATPLIRLVGAVLAEQHDEWAESRRYLGLEVLSKSLSRPQLTDRTGGHPSGTDRLTQPVEESRDELVHHAPTDQGC